MRQEQEVDDQVVFVRGQTLQHILEIFTRILSRASALNLPTLQDKLGDETFRIRLGLKLGSRR